MENQCPECSASHLVTDYKRAEIVCMACGLILEENLILDEELPNNTVEMLETHGPGYNKSLHDGGISTVICERNYDSHGKPLSRDASWKFRRLRKWQKKFRVQNAVDKNLSTALTKINSHCSNLELNKTTRETAAVYYKKAVQQKILRGRSVEWIIAAVIYAACRTCGNPVTLDEIAKVTGISKQEIGRTFRNVNRFLKLRVPTAQFDIFLSRYCSQLQLTAEAETLSRNILHLAFEQDLVSGKNLSGLAAAAIYISTMNTFESRTQKRISDITGVTQVTIRNRYKELERELIWPKDLECTLEARKTKKA